MRLSDERLDRLERHILNINSVDPEPRPSRPDFRTVNDNDTLALIAEVRALRKCERALELLIGRIPPDADPFESGDLWIGAGGIIAGRTALAAVRALEDKP